MGANAAASRDKVQANSQAFIPGLMPGRIAANKAHMAPVNGRRIPLPTANVNASMKKALEFESEMNLEAFESGLPQDLSRKQKDKIIHAAKTNQYKAVERLAK